MKKENVFMSDGHLCPSVVSSEIMDILVKAQRAKAVADTLCQDYFVYSKEYYKKNLSELLKSYENAQAFAGVVNEYLYDIKALLEELQSSIDRVDFGRGKEE